MVVSLATWMDRLWLDLQPTSGRLHCNPYRHRTSLLEMPLQWPESTCSSQEQGVRYGIRRQERSY
jgi:hypothetical protein